MFFITVGQEHECSKGMSLKGREEAVVLKCGKMIMDEKTIAGEGVFWSYWALRR